MTDGDTVSLLELPHLPNRNRCAFQRLSLDSRRQHLHLSRHPYANQQRRRCDRLTLPTRASSRIASARVFSIHRLNRRAAKRDRHVTHCVPGALSRIITITNTNRISQTSNFIQRHCAQGYERQQHLKLKYLCPRQNTRVCETTVLSICVQLRTLHPLRYWLDIPGLPDLLRLK